jgi:hypothetical protein
MRRAGARACVTLARRRKILAQCARVRQAASCESLICVNDLARLCNLFRRECIDCEEAAPIAPAGARSAWHGPCSFVTPVPSFQHWRTTDGKPESGLFQSIVGIAPLTRRTGATMTTTATTRAACNPAARAIATQRAEWLDRPLRGLRRLRSRQLRRWQIGLERTGSIGQVDMARWYAATTAKGPNYGQGGSSRGAGYGYGGGGESQRRYGQGSGSYGYGGSGSRSWNEPYGEGQQYTSRGDYAGERGAADTVRMAPPARLRLRRPGRIQW